MEKEKQLSDNDLNNILSMLEAKKHFLATLENNLKAINEIIPLVKSCCNDYELQIQQVKSMLEQQTVAGTEKTEESKA